MNLLLFKLSTCGPCKVLSKTFNDCKIPHEEIVIDEDNRYLEDKYNVKSVPTVIITDENGEEVGRFTGVKNKDRLIAELAKYKVEFEKNNASI